MEFNIADFNPANAKSLSKEQLAAMQTFSMEELKALAEAYPNKPTQPAYLILKDSKVKENTKQIYNRSTWQNLYALWKVGQKNYVAFSFISVFVTPTAAQAPVKVQDLKADDVNKAPGIKQTLSPDKPKDLNKMKKEELHAEYKRVFEVDADKALNKADLIAAIQKGK